MRTGPLEEVIEKPFSPADASAAKINNIPNEVIRAVNVLLAKNIDNAGNATIKQKDIVDIAMGFLRKIHSGLILLRQLMGYHLL